MRQTIKAKHELRLYELKKAVNEFLEFTENLTLLQAVNEKVQEMAEAVDALQQVLKQGLAANKLTKAMADSEAATLLDELVDADAVSELEAYMLSAAGNVEDAEITQFLTEIMDKVEHKYNLLLEKAHAYNALLKD
jgi:predicted transcriptional regulator